MVDIVLMAKKELEFLSEAERAVILGDDKALQKRQLGFRLTNEAVSILDEEAERLGIDRTKALEILLREIRELRKRGKKV